MTVEEVALSLPCWLCGRLNGAASPPFENSRLAQLHCRGWFRICSELASSLADVSSLNKFRSSKFGAKALSESAPVVAPTVVSQTCR